MRRWVVPLVVVVLALATVASLQRLQSGTRTGFAAPDFELPDLHGQPHRLSDLRGRVVFLNLWTTWCPPCREEMPAMEALHRRLRARGLVVLAVSQDTNGAEAVAPFVAEMGLSFPVLLDPDGRLSTRYGVTGYPETFIIDRNGNVVHHTIGPADWASDAVLAQFDALLDQGAANAAVPVAAN
jgi:peroxiredoxin